MKLTPIEKLAEQVEITVLTRSYTNQMEALRQAIIKDFVSTLEPVGYRMSVHPRGDYLMQKYKPKSARSDLWVPLFDLSEWSEK